jgi:DNA-binding GntR family transcriptional regulator
MPVSYRVKALEARTRAKRHPRAGTPSGLSSPDRVVEAIVRGLRAGVYVPGQRLIEADLTRDLSVSRGPVREALKRLAAEGVISLTRHRGAYIHALSREEVNDSLVVLEVLTGLMARLAATRIGTGENEAKMRKALDSLLAFRASGGGAAFLEERRRFYDTLIEIGGNHQLRRILPLMQIHLLRMQFQSYATPHDRDEQFAEYTAISKAVLAGDPAKAERVTRAHIRRTAIRLNRLPDEAFGASTDQAAAIATRKEY